MLNPGLSIAGTVPFGVNIPIPDTSGKEGTRKTNHSYHKGTIEEMVDILVDEKVPLFVSSVGVPPKWAVKKMKDAGMLLANICGSPYHVKKSLGLGIDIIIVTGTEAGGHSGEISTLVLLPECADLCKGKTIIVGGGGVSDGRGMTAMFALGAQGVWIGTKFLMSHEANTNVGLKKALLEAKSSDTLRSEIYTGRPARLLKTKHNLDWSQRETEMRALLKKGKIPVYHELEKGIIDKYLFISPLSRAMWKTGIGKNTTIG